MTAPISDAAVVLGKFLGVLGFYIFLWATTIPYLFILNHYGTVDFGPVVSLYAGMLLLGSAYIALGLFASSLTRDQIIALILTLVAVVMTMRVPAELNAYRVQLLQSGNLERAEALREVLETVFISEHMLNSAMGVISTRSIVFFGAVAFVFLFLTTKVLESRKWKGGGVSAANTSAFGQLTLYGGLVGVVSLLVALAWGGLVAWSGGAAEQGLFGALLLNMWPGVLLYGGLALVLASVLANLRFFAGLVVAGRALLFANVMVQVVAVVAVSVFAVLLSDRYSRSFDLTGWGAYGLSRQTRQRVEALDVERPATLHLVWTQYTAQPAGGIQEYKLLQRLLRQYADLSPKIDFEEIDTVIQPDRVRELIALTGVSEKQLRDRCVLVTSGDRYRVLQLNDLFEYESGGVRPGAGQPMPSAFVGEAALTEAMMSIYTRRYLVTFVADAGAAVPRAPQKSMGFPGALQRLSRILEVENFDTRVVMLENEPIPSETDILFVVGPTAMLSERARAQIEGYLASKGGAALFALGPQSDGGLSGILSSKGLRPTGKVIRPTAMNLLGQRFPDQQGLLGTAPREHPIVAKVATPVDDPADADPNKSVKMKRAVAIELLKNTPGWSPRPVLVNYTPGSAWLPGSGGSRFEIGPFVLMASSEGAIGKETAPSRTRDESGEDGVSDTTETANAQVRPTLNRIVLIGDPQMLEDRLMADKYNKGVASNTVNWLVGRGRMISGIGARRISYLELNLTDHERQWIVLVTVIFMPAAVLLVGGGLWWIRRR